VDNKSFLEYLASAKIGYDPDKQEAWFVDGGSDYSYIYDVVNNVWSKRSSVYITIFSDYPKLYGIRPDNALFSLSGETSAAFQNVFMQTRPMKMSDGFNKIRRLLLRGLVHTGGSTSLFGIYLFASQDGINYAMVDGKELQDMARDGIALASHFSAKYFILAMAGRILSDSYLTHFDVELTHALGSTIR
jgi:hypothetical protein